jgi:inhibitor of KinA sporulation pathway (predicted exonuclease)
MLTIRQSADTLKLIGELHCELNALCNFLHNPKTAGDAVFAVWADRVRVLGSKCDMLDDEVPSPSPVSESLLVLQMTLGGVAQLRRAVGVCKGKSEWGSDAWQSYQQAVADTKRLARTVRDTFDDWAFLKIAPALHAASAGSYTGGDDDSV